MSVYTMTNECHYYILYLKVRCKNVTNFNSGIIKGTAFILYF